jgi:hypothetical protein
MFNINKIVVFILTFCFCNVGLNAQKTIVEIKGNQFYINGKPTYEGRVWNGHKIEGLLMNSRMVQGVFDDLNPETVAEFAYADTKKWDADRNTNEFIAAMPQWYAHGLRAFTLNMQGGSPYGYGNKKCLNPGFNPDGSLMQPYMNRLDRILKKADELNMVVILGLFYFGQDQNVTDEAAVINVVDNITNWILEKGYRHVMIEINNECDYPTYDHAILKPKRVHELIERVKNKQQKGYRLLVSTSFTGKKVPTANVVKAADFILLHGNGTKDPKQIQRLIDSTKMVESYRNMPIVNNEDDHFDFEKDTNNLIVSVKNYVSWGYFDFRFKGETDYTEGYQSVPVDWGINSARKKGFFNKLKEITGGTQTVKKNLEKDDFIKIEAESTPSNFDKWHIIKQGEPNYVADASGKAHIEFSGNNPDTGEPNSPLTYTFTAPKDGSFRLLMMSSKRLEGVRGDMCNDAYVKMEGDFQSATNLDNSVLKNYLKYFQEGSVKTPENAWHWGIRAEQGRHQFFNLIYTFKKGQTYTLTLAGRSQRFNVDYLVFYDNDKMTVKEAQVFFTNQVSLSTNAQKTEAEKNGNPIVPYVGMADPHVFVFNGKPYLYTTRDIDSLQAKGKFIMPDWHIWSTEDMVNWKHERTILPTETYMGKSNDCWATEVAERKGKYYFYFSDKNKTTGVMVGDSPIGPFKDALGKPMLDTNLTTSKEYDPSVLTDDDANKTAYIIFGHHRDIDPTLGYYIAKLSDDMVSLAEKPRKIKFEGTANVLGGNDKPNLHKYNGLYYLSAGSHYAVSKNIYGPYTKWGNSGFDKFGLTPQAHGNYFMWNNQWFHTWCKFHLGKEVAYYRESYLTYLHYKKDGTMMDDTTLLNKHFANGVGQYDANWDNIEAEWYMAADKTEKGETATGFEINTCKKGGYLYFPKIRNVKTNTKIAFKIKSISGGTIEIREDNVGGKLLGTLKIDKSDAHNYSEKVCSLKNTEGVKNLYFVFKGDENKNLFSIDGFRFE